MKPLASPRCEWLLTLCSQLPCYVPTELPVDHRLCPGCLARARLGSSLAPPSPNFLQSPLAAHWSTLVRHAGPSIPETLHDAELGKTFVRRSQTLVSGQVPRHLGQARVTAGPPLIINSILISYLQHAISPR